MRNSFSALLFPALMFCVLPATAQTEIYDNGPTTGNSSGWFINSPFAVSDSFVANQPATVTGISFNAWLFPDQVLESINVKITSDEYGGNIYFDEDLSLSQGSCVENRYGYNVCTETSSPFTASLPDGGAYWLNLSNAQSNTGAAVYWDENSGPSLASQAGIGTIPSESFTVFGSVGTGSTPEPSSVLLFGSGMVALAGFLRRKR